MARIQGRKATGRQKPDPQVFRSAAEAELADAKAYKYNSFKIEMAKRAVVRALTTVAAIS
jgi:xanthine dehydrogenase YagS FAD-binding subunit